MARDLRIRNARPLGGPATDILIRDGRFAAPGAAPPGGDVETIDAGGQLMLPGLVESHMHLDKTLWSLPWRPNSAGPTLRDYIDNERRVRATIEVPVGRRAEALLRQCIAMGSTTIRSHVDVYPEIGLSGVEALLALRDAYADKVSIQLVAFPQAGMLIAPGTAELMEEAVKSGVDIVGGIDPAGVDGDPIGHLRTVFGIAERRGCGVDIHLHDRGELGAWEVERIVDFTAAAGLDGRVMISHAYCLGEIDPLRLDGIAARLVRHRVSLLSSAPADVALPPVRQLRAAGVTLCLGSDGIRDLWSPFGNGDMLERAMLLAYRFDWNKDEDLAAALAAATGEGARALGLSGYGLSEGCDADAVILPAESVGEAVVARPRRSFVLKRGRVVARDGVLGAG